MRTNDRLLSNQLNELNASKAANIEATTNKRKLLKASAVQNVTIENCARPVTWLRPLSDAASQLSLLRT